MSMTVHSPQMGTWAYISPLFSFFDGKIFVNVCFNGETNFIVTILFNTVVTS